MFPSQTLSDMIAVVEQKCFRISLEVDDLKRLRRCHRTMIGEIIEQIYEALGEQDAAYEAVCDKLDAYIRDKDHVEEANALRERLETMVDASADQFIEALKDMGFGDSDASDDGRNTDGDGEGEGDEDGNVAA